MVSRISHEAIWSFVQQLDDRILTDAPPSYLPTILPLALPSPLHTVNFFTTLHLVYDVLSSPTHAAYFIESDTNARDTAIRGTVSLFLGSEEDWNPDNLLSSPSWKAGRLDERAMAEHFEIKVVREREHETMKAIRVGERWDKAAAAAQALVTLFAELGARLQGRCLGEAVEALVGECSHSSADDAITFARLFSDQATELVPSMSPSAPLRLLQVLARRQADAADLNLTLPSPADLADVSPVPLSLPVLLRLGILDYQHLDEPARAQIQSILSTSFDPMSATPAPVPSPTSISAVPLPRADIDDFAKLSIEACTYIRQACHTTENATIAVQTRLSFEEVWRVCALLEERMVQQGQGFMLVAQ